MRQLIDEYTDFNPGDGYVSSPVYSQPVSITPIQTPTPIQTYAPVQSPAPVAAPVVPTYSPIPTYSPAPSPVPTFTNQPTFSLVPQTTVTPSPVNDVQISSDPIKIWVTSPVETPTQIYDAPASYVKPEPVYTIQPVSNPVVTGGNTGGNNVLQPPIDDNNGGGGGGGIVYGTTGSQAQYSTILNQLMSETDAIISAAASGQLTGDQAQSQLVSLIQDWESYKFSAPANDQGWLYQQETQNFKPKWDAATLQFSQLAAATTTNTTGTTTTPATTGTTTTPATGGTTTTPTTTQTTPAATQNTIFGIPEQYLIYGGIAALGILFLTSSGDE